MNQQINLVNIALIKPKPLITFNSLVAILAAIAVILVGYYAFLQKEVTALKVQREKIATDLTNSQNEIKALALLHAPQAKDTSLEDKITQLEQKVKSQQQVLEILRQSTLSPDKSYAGLMRALARQSVDGLWLTGFSIDSNTNTVNIQGRALHGDLVPKYINRLSNEASLQGKQFSGLNISLPKAETTTSGTTVAETTPKAPASTAGLAPIKSKTRSSATLNTPSYIEFTLESKLDHSTSLTASASSNTTQQAAATGEKP